MTLRDLIELSFKAIRYSFNPARAVLVTMVVIVLLLRMAAAQTVSDSFQTGQQEVTARLSGFNEVHLDPGGRGTPPSSPELRGAVSTPASGKFRAIIDENARTIAYELSYEDLRAPVTQAHIHFGQRHTIGGIIVWLCQTSTNRSPVAVTPECPQEGTVSGTITPDQVLAQPAQGFPAGDFDELVRAIRNRAAYVNVHSSLFPPGEIRGHIRKTRDRNH